MRAAVMHEPKKPLVIEELDVENPHAGEVVVRLAASGVCRSDLHALEGESPVATPPMVLGHEGAGIVGKSHSTNRRLSYRYRNRPE